MGEHGGDEPLGELGTKRRAGAGQRASKLSRSWLRFMHIAALYIALGPASIRDLREARHGRLGYRFIEYAQWSHTNYRSVVLSKALR